MRIYDSYVCILYPCTYEPCLVQMNDQLNLLGLYITDHSCLKALLLNIVIHLTVLNILT